MKQCELADDVVMASWVAQIDRSWGRLHPEFFTRQLMVNKVGEQTGEQIAVKISGIEYFCGLRGFIQ